jgi:hypothetical protein
MKRRFLYLVVLTSFALLALWVFALKDESPDRSAADTLLLPEISEQINIVDRVEIVTAGNQVVATLLKSEKGWQLEQMGGYHADWPNLQTLLSALAQARVVETKTDKPEYYNRLGVEDITAADAGGVLVKLGIGDQIAGIVVGHQAQARQGQYVRLQRSAASALIDRRLDVSTESSDWVDATIVDINAAEVAEVEIIHPTGERVLVMRISADQTDFDLAGLSTGREIKSSWAVNSLGSVFSMLELDTVRAEGSVEWSDAVRMRLLLFSGVEIMAEMLEAEDEYLLRMSASHPAANVIDKPVGDVESTESQKEIENQAAIDVAKMVEDINQKTAGWIYGIPKNKYDAMVKKPEDLLKPQESV